MDSAESSRNQREQDAPAAADVSPASEHELRIEELRRSVQSGSYRVDASELSKKIVDKHIVRRK
ncbi:MAG: flagellar biosynthesis anti-sigma factor FlgM [Acidobacteriaceae bacterium]|nr:flagellar biosynthesis anti-sigma factor FlgM [Acidobacteriaceae bacterium]